MGIGDPPFPRDKVQDEHDAGVFLIGCFSFLVLSLIISILGVRGKIQYKWLIPILSVVNICWVAYNSIHFLYVSNFLLYVLFIMAIVWIVLVVSVLKPLARSNN
jgi:hypothetical protein